MPDSPVGLISFSGSLQAGRRVVVPMMFAMALSSCGYHLVGQGDGTGAIPEDVTTISVQVAGEVSQGFLAALKRQFSRSGHYKLIAVEAVVDEQSHAEIRIKNMSESFVPSAYDLSGLATQYRMTFSGNIHLYRANSLLWESGTISMVGDVFVTGGPTGTESSRQRIRDDLQKEWIITAWGRINSGF
jgi:outer membrane lipopolysaccharide assembly protein LptE/RlpB